MQPIETCEGAACEVDPLAKIDFTLLELAVPSATAG
jgi:hypothetical protein